MSVFFLIVSSPFSPAVTLTLKVKILSNKHISQNHLKKLEKNFSDIRSHGRKEWTGPQETGDRRTAFRLRTAGWRCHPSTQSGFLPVVTRARSGEGAWRAQSARLFRWELGILEHCRPASECMTSGHTPLSFSLTRKQKEGDFLFFLLSE